MSERLPDDEIVGPDRRDPAGKEKQLGDFTLTPSTLRLVPLAAVVGLLSAGVALVLLKLIALVTNVAYFQSAGTELRNPSGHTLGALAVAIPVVGGLVVGVMARFGSERIRGHGIPEAMETILVGGSKAEPRVAVLKPISSAVSIGTGGPFGAEGPIVLTGGAVGSVLAQFFHLSAIERRSLLVAGAAGGMSAVFGTPIAAVLLGVELLVFEWKPRSMVLIGIASAVAAAVRDAFSAAGWLEDLPLFPTTVHVDPGLTSLLAAVVIGVAGAGTAWLLTKAVYGAEDLFNKLPIHWLWWPAIGGLAIGIGGLIEPRALGVGYDVIGNEIAGRIAIAGLVSIFVVKLAIWAIALGSGTSGGILAPILIMGAAMGGLLSPLLPGGSAGAWALLGMGATLAGATRSPLMAIVFAFELTHDADMLPPLLLAATLAHLFSVLWLKRSILTEKVARRGFHVLREYSVGALDALFVRDVLTTQPLSVATTDRISDVYRNLGASSHLRHQRLLPVVDRERLVGVVPWTDVLERAAASELEGTIEQLMRRDVVVAHPDENLREVAERMAGRRVGVLPVVERGTERVCGIVTQFDLLAAHERVLQEERHRERVLRPRPLVGIGRGRPAG